MIIIFRSTELNNKKRKYCQSWVSFANNIIYNYTVMIDYEVMMKRTLCHQMWLSLPLSSFLAQDECHWINAATNELDIIIDWRFRYSVFFMTYHFC